MQDCYWTQENNLFKLYGNPRTGTIIKECVFSDPNVSFTGPGVKDAARKWFLEVWCRENDMHPVNTQSLPLRHPDWDIYQEVMQCVEKYMGQSDCRAERWENFTYPQRLGELRDMARMHILREAGDIKAYLRLEKAICALGQPGAHYDRTIRAMMEWLQGQMDRVTDIIAPKGGLVISLLVWGQKYPQKMLDYNFKSLMAEGNLPSRAKDFPITMFIQCDKATRKTIEAAAITEKIKATGVTFDYAIIPDDLIAAINNDIITYWMVGTGASIALHYAKCAEAAFHISYPDIIYSDKYFSELFRLSVEHKSILAPGMRSDQSQMIPALVAYEKDNTISVPAADLMALHMNHLHMVAWPYVVNNRPRKWMYPVSHVMLWESEDMVYFNCPHLDAMWLDYSVIKDLPERYYMSLDSEMDFVCKNHDFYTPQETDELYRAELSEQGRQLARDLYDNASAAANHLWSVITHRDTLKFFLHGMKVPVSRKIRPIPENVMPQALISAERGFLYNTILSYDPYAHIHIARKRWHDDLIYSFVK